MSIVIKAENVYKQYRLGEVGSGSMRDDIKRWRYKMMGREDPFLTVGEENDRTVKSNSKYVWALKDINFEVEQGEILGIIGKNGAGKSTLLKILSRTTGPTKGTIKMKGRVASLLEVGTGFHGELSGRENIYLNGAIMGMRREEITRKLDEIIDFAGVEKFIDTPVKRYSSGMYVRLAFGVAAHLEPDIMIVDEVLAVGDAEFQNKALGKMKDVSTRGGRTVLFVSHNMAAVRKLTRKSMFLKNGSIRSIGDTDNMIDLYGSESIASIKKFNFNQNQIENKPLQFLDVSFLNQDFHETSTLISGKKAMIKFKIINKTDRVFKNCSVGIAILTITDHLLIALKNDTEDKYYNLKPGVNEIMCHIDKFPLSAGTFKYNVILNKGSEIFDWVKEVGIFEVETGLFFSNGKIPAPKTPSVLVDHFWL